MFALLVHDPAAPPAPTHKTYFGGRPTLPIGSTWPVCRSCQGNMQFLGQVQDGASSHIALFMCQNDPGLCDEWDPESGGNHACQVGDVPLALIDAPADGNVSRSESYGMRPVICHEDNYADAREAWLAAGGEARAILGSLGGVPDWLQADETPTCSNCAAPMDFVAQLEEGPDHRSAMNFGGGGSAYVFRCNCERKPARLLWQC